MSELVRRELRESAAIIASVDDGQVLLVAETLVKVFKAKRKVVLFGNGGSAADAQHIAAEFSGRYMMERAPLNAIALTNLSSITAIGNDYSYETVFERQVEGHVREGDAVIGISTSGNSKNVLRAVAKAKELGAVTIGFSGSAGMLKDAVDVALVIGSRSTPRIQEGYMAAAHIICGLVEKAVFGRRAVFVDRDDTIAKDVPYCPSPDELVLFGGVGGSIKRLNDAGFLVIVVTNQSGVGRGYFTESKLSEIHDKMRSDLARDGAKLDAIYFCPHLPEEGCECRKPNIGMVLQAMMDFDIDLSTSFVVGDSEREMELARRIGAKGIQVSPGFDFNQAVDRILNER
jgi:D-sedoheptulose 7-phosphate isomerase